MTFSLGKALIALAALCGALALARGYTREVNASYRPFMTGDVSPECFRVARTALANQALLGQTYKEVYQIKVTVFCDEKSWQEAVASSEQQPIANRYLTGPRSQSAGFNAPRLAIDRFPSRRLAVLKAFAEATSGGDETEISRRVAQWLAEEQQKQEQK